MNCLFRLVSVSLSLMLLAGTAAAQTESPDAELAKVRSELAATQKALTETRQALGKNQAAAREKLAETIRTAETLRKKLVSDNAQLKTTAAELDLVTREAARTKAELVAAQMTLADVKFAKTQADLAKALKTLAETKEALTNKQAELTDSKKARDILDTEVATERARSIAAVSQLELASKEAAQAKAELVAAQKKQADAKQANTQKELSTSQKTLAEAHTAADELRKDLEAEIKNSVARLEAAHKETALIRKELKNTADKLVLTTQEDVRTRAELSAAEKTLALQPNLPATIVLTLPADALVTFDKHLTSSIGGRRVYTSPALPVGPTFYYTVKANVMRGDKVVTMEKVIAVRAGDQIQVSLALPVAELGQP